VQPCFILFFWDSCGVESMTCGWVQIKMISDPRQIGGQQTAGAVPPGVASSVLDMFGCGANYRR
jgi:hypothetical protein